MSLCLQVTGGSPHPQCPVSGDGCKLQGLACSGSPWVLSSDLTLQCSCIVKPQDSRIHLTKRQSRIVLEPLSVHHNPSDGDAGSDCCTLHWKGMEQQLQDWLKAHRVTCWFYTLIKEVWAVLKALLCKIDVHSIEFLSFRLAHISSQPMKIRLFTTRTPNVNNFNINTFGQRARLVNIGDTKICWRKNIDTTLPSTVCDWTLQWLRVSRRTKTAITFSMTTLMIKKFTSIFSSNWEIVGCIFWM